MGRIPEDGEFYVTATLLSSDGGDTNRRQIYCWPEDTPVCVFNQWMRPWTHRDELRLHIVLDALNNAREKP